MTARLHLLDGGGLDTGLAGRTEGGVRQSDTRNGTWRAESPLGPVRSTSGVAPVVADLDIPALYRRYGDLVFARCRTLLRNEADAQDAVQEVFLKLHRFRDSFRGDSSASTFLYRITTTTCLNRMRSRRRRPEDPVEELPPLPSSESVLDALAVRQLLDELLADADDRTQACLVYHYVDGMTHDETGEMIGLSGAAVRKRIAAFKDGISGRSPPWMEDE
jgi:RNA polymerase sigma-70 factor (ECF subfamily)